MWGILPFTELFPCGRQGTGTKPSQHPRNGSPLAGRSPAAILHVPCGGCHCAPPPAVPGRRHRPLCRPAFSGGAVSKTVLDCRIPIFKSPSAGAGRNPVPADGLFSGCRGPPDPVKTPEARPCRMHRRGNRPAPCEKARRPPLFCAGPRRFPGQGAHFSRGRGILSTSAGHPAGKNRKI